MDSELKFYLTIASLVLAVLLIFNLPRILIGWLFSKVATPAFREAMAPTLKWMLFLPKRIFLDHLILLRHCLNAKSTVFPSLSNPRKKQKKG